MSIQILGDIVMAYELLDRSEFVENDTYFDENNQNNCALCISNQANCHSTLT